MTKTPPPPITEIATPTPATTTATAGGGGDAFTNNSSDLEVDDEDYSYSMTLNTEKNQTLAQRETRAVQCLRLFVLGVLLVTGAVASAFVYLYTRNDETNQFETAMDEAAAQVLDKFHGLIEQSLVAASTLSATMTTYATRNNETFPFVTMPHFELLASHLRVSSGSHIVHWMPFVTDQERDKWEDYALENRFHIDESFQRDAAYRALQDAEFGIVVEETGPLVPPPTNTSEVTILDDGTGYHPKIHSITGGVPRDEPEGAGPFMILWQRSPINPARQRTLNTNWAKLPILAPNIIDTIIQERKALINTASVPPNDYFKAGQGKNLQLSQYRENVKELIDGPSTYITYPVFDSLDQATRSVKGVLATSIYWRVLFSRLLPEKAPTGIICVVENSFNQFFSFRLDGPEATWIGFGDAHDPKFDDKYQYSTDINSYLQSRAGPLNRPYTSVGFSDSVKYTIRVFPSDDTRDEFITSAPFTYTVSFVAAFVFAAILFIVFSYVVERRQKIMIQRVISNAKRAATAERELNEFLSHEVRNPLSIAITACSFVTSALMDPQRIMNDANLRRDVCEDLEVVNSSLTFINDFLRSMLDTHRASVRKLKVQMAPTDVLGDIFQPVSNLLYNRGSTFKVLVECPKDLVVMSDCIRLKQVILNLARNATKFVEHGYIRMRADVDSKSNRCRLYVEDSGPGIPVEKRRHIFGKYQESLDLLNQGTGIGLALSKKLMKIMNGDIWLDESYHSSVEGCPGARFVVELNASPMDIEPLLLRTEAASPSLYLKNEAASPSLLLKNEAENGASDTVTDASDSKSTTDTAPGTTAKLDIQQINNIITPPKTDTPDLEQGVSQDQNLFTSTLPNVPSKIPPPPEPPLLNTGPELPEGLSVLFVDDDAVLRKLFSRALSRVAPSWKIKEAACGEIALELCESETFDLIFMDQYMASVNKQLLGTETIERLRSKGVQSAICGLSANDIRGVFIRAGADDFTLKPLPCKAEALKPLLHKVMYGKMPPTTDSAAS